jgi:hypothetical protein
VDKAQTNIQKSKSVKFGEENIRYFESDGGTITDGTVWNPDSGSEADVVTD